MYSCKKNHACALVLRCEGWTVKADDGDVINKKKTEDCYTT